VPDRASNPEWLEAANRLSTIAQQIATAAHEANNLLQVITGNAEMLELGRDTQEQVIRRAQIIGEHASRTSELLSTVLELSREGSLQVEAVDLRRMIERALKVRKYALARAGITASSECGDRQVYALANRRQTMQILLNLVMNAERALAGRERARLFVRALRDGNEIVLSVQDNGPGIREGGPQQPAVMTGTEPAAATRLGIGLRVANWLALAQSGTLMVTAAESGGTVATLRLPAA
jgi:C4-dicarboxylate-specific signal transduction histidine kinase